jgi:WD40 repeat protein
VNFDGPVRVSETTPAGKAAITLSLKTWKGVAVSSTTHDLTVLPVKPRPKVEPISPNLIASLVHPDRQASVLGIKFSQDGSQLFATGNPSGIVQIWNLASKKEMRRIDTARGRNDVLVTPDWKTLFVPVEKRTVKQFESDGKRRSRVEESGKIRIWDVPSGKEKEPLLPTPGSAPVAAYVAPSGRYLVSIERPSYESGTPPKCLTVAWDLVDGKKWTLHDGYTHPMFSPDEKTIALRVYPSDRKKSPVVLLDFPGGKQLAQIECEKDKIFSLGPFSSNGSFVEVALAGKKGDPLEVWFLDAKTLKVCGKLVGKGNHKDHRWGGRGLFTRDSKRYVAIDRAGNALLWDLANQKLEHSFSIGILSAQHVAISPDGKTLAVGWMPKADTEGLREIEPDPADLPQPRVTLVDLAGTAPPRTLVAPHGYVGDLVFSPDGKTLAFGSSGAVHLFDLTR